MEKINYLLDKRISFKAKGIITFGLLNHFSFNDFLNHTKDGKDSLRAGINELIKYGYCQTIRQKELDGKFSNVLYDFKEYVQI